MKEKVTKQLRNAIKELQCAVCKLLDKLVELAAVPDMMSCLYNDQDNRNEFGTLTSVIVDDVEYILDEGSPIIITTILIGGTLWNTWLSDFINDLNIPNFYAEYPSEAEIAIINALPGGSGNGPHHWNVIKLFHEVGATFKITIHDLSGGDAFFTESTVSVADGVFNPENFSYLFNPQGCEDV